MKKQGNQSRFPPTRETLMADEIMTQEEAEKITFREIDVKELEASIPLVRETVESLEEAKKISPELLRSVINI